MVYAKKRVSVKRRKTTRRYTGPARVVVPRYVPYSYAPPKEELKFVGGTLALDNVPNDPVYAGDPLNGPPNSASSLRPLAVIAQGTTVGQRIGRQIFVKSFQCKLEVNSTLALDASAQCNVMLVYDKNCNGAILTPANLQSGAATFIRSMRNLDYRDRFQVLLSRDFTLNPQSMSGNKMVIDLYKKLNHKILYSNGDAQVSSCPAGQLYFIISADAGDTPASHKINVNGRTRIRYVG